MANIVARHFLNDRGFKQLESSEGAVNVVHKKKKIGELTASISRLDNFIGRNEKKLAKKEAKIAELDSIGFVKKLLSLGKIKKEKAVIQAEIDAIKEQTASYEAERSVAEYEIVFLSNEIKRFEKKLAAVGLTAEDIIEEYKAIVEEIKQREAERKTAAEAAQKPTDIKVAKKPEQADISPALKRFQARQAKHEKIVAEKQKGQE